MWCMGKDNYISFNSESTEWICRGERDKTNTEGIQGHNPDCCKFVLLLLPFMNLSTRKWICSITKSIFLSVASSH